MKILVDARELAGRRTGVGRYLAELLRRWASSQARTGHEFVLCAPEVSGGARETGIRSIDTGGRGGTWWEQVRLPRVIAQESPDVLFCPAYTAPLAASVPTVVTIHDVSFAAHPEWFSWREGLRRRMLTRLAAHRTAAIVTVSEFSAGEIAAFFHVPRSRIHVIRHGVAHVARRPPLPREPLVLFVGSIFNRRHLPELMAAVRQILPHVRELRLVIVGENRTQPRIDLAAEASRLNLEGIVELAEYVDDERLASLFARARVFAFVSDYEGFGLTPLEALGAGVPPIVADTPVAHETCGHAAFFVRPGDVDGLARAIRTLLTDDAAREQVLGAAPAVLSQYSWDRAADQTLRLLEEAGQL